MSRDPREFGLMLSKTKNLFWPNFDRKSGSQKKRNRQIPPRIICIRFLNMLCRIQDQIKKLVLRSG